VTSGQVIAAAPTDLSRYSKLTLVYGLDVTDFDPSFGPDSKLISFTGTLWAHNASWGSAWSPIS